MSTIDSKNLSLNNETNLFSVKQFLNKMHSFYPIEDFVQTVDKQTGGKFTFTQIKALLDKYYPSSFEEMQQSKINNDSNHVFSKKDKISLLKAFSKHCKNSSTVLISLYQFFSFIERILESYISSPTLAFYSVAEMIESKRRVSTLEFIYKCDCHLNDELNVNDFINKITHNLQLNDMTSIILFKGLDYNKTGKVKVEDFVLVVDSYREDYLTNPESLIHQKGNDNDRYKNNSQQGNNFNITLKKHAIVLNNALNNNYVSLDEVFRKTNEIEDINNSDINNNGKNIVRADLLMKVLFDEVTGNVEIEEFEEESKTSNRDKMELENNKIMEAISKIVSELKSSQGTIDKAELEGLLSEMIMTSRANPINSNTTNNFLTNNTTSSGKKLSDSEQYWISKLLVNMEDIQLTPSALFQTCIENLNSSKTNFNNTNFNLLPNTIINIETFKRKLKLLLPPGRLNTMDINNIGDVFNFNRNHLVSYKDFIEAFEAVKKNGDSDNYNNTVSNFKKTKFIENLPNILGQSQNNKIMNTTGMSNISTARNTMNNTFNTWSKGVKSINFHLLPVRGNHKVLNKIKEEVKRENFDELFKKSIKDDKANNTVRLNSSVVKNTLSSTLQNKNERTIIFNKDEELVATESLPKNNAYNNTKEETIRKSMYDNKDNKDNKDKSLNFSNQFISHMQDDTPLTDALESFFIFNETGLVPSLSLNLDLKNKLLPNYTKLELSEIIKEIDINKIGLISNQNIMYYLQNFEKHLSTKLAYREIIRKITLELNSEIFPFITNGLRNYINNNNSNTQDQGNNIDKEVVSMKILVDYLHETFDIDKVIGKKVYSDLRVIFKTFNNQKYRSTSSNIKDNSDKKSITITDFAEILIDIQESNALTKDAINNGNKQSTNQPGFMTINKNREAVDRGNSNIKLSEKSFEEEIKLFIRQFSSITSITHSSKKETISSIKIFRENIKASLSSTLPNSMNLLEFKDLFMKPLSMKNELGLAIFQLIRNFSNKEQYVKLEDLMMLLESYVEETMNSSNANNQEIKKMNNNVNFMSFNNENISFTGKAFVELLEQTGCAFKLCLDSIHYNFKGFVTSLEVFNKLVNFYPSINKKIIMLGIKLIEESTYSVSSDKNNYKSNKSSNLTNSCVRGYINYTQLQFFLKENSSKIKFCPILEVYKLASYLDLLSYRTTTLDFFTDKGVKNFYSVEFKEHSTIFDFLCSTLETKEEFFIYLSEKSINQLEILKENNFKASSYNLIRLVDLVDFYRVNKPLPGESGKKNESNQDYCLNEFASNKLMNIQKINKLNDSTKLACSLLISIHNEEINIDDLISFLNMNITNDISSISVSLLFKSYFSGSENDMKSLVILISLLDTNKKGYFKYSYMNDVFSSILPGFCGSIVLHAKYILNNVLLANKGVLKENDFKDYSEVKIDNETEYSIYSLYDKFDEIYKIVEVYFEKRANDIGLSLANLVNKPNSSSSNDYLLKFMDFEKLVALFFNNKKKLLVKLFNFLVINAKEQLSKMNSNNKSSTNFFMLNSNKVGKPEISSTTASIDSLSFKSFIKFISCAYTYNIGIGVSSISSSLYNLQSIENLSNYNISSINTAKQELNIKTSEDELDFVEKYCQYIEKKKVPFKFLVNNLNPKRISQTGRISLEYILQALNEKYNLKNKDSENLVFISYFLDEFNNRLFDLFKFVNFLKIHSTMSFDNMDFKDYKSEFINKLKFNITSKSLKDEESISLDNFALKFNLKIGYKYNISEIISIFNSIFKISNFDCFLLMLNHFNVNNNNSLTNNQDNNVYLIIENMLTSLNLISLFKSNESKKEVYSSNTEVIIDNTLKVALEKFGQFILSKSNINTNNLGTSKSKSEIKKFAFSLFQKYDSNKDGYLSNNEFINLLNSPGFEDANLNESQKMQIIRLVDTNKDEKILYNEFLEFLSNLINNSNYNNSDKGKDVINTHKYKTTSKLISQSAFIPIKKEKDNIKKKAFKPKLKIDYEQLKENTEFNMSNISKYLSLNKDKDQKFIDFIRLITYLQIQYHEEYEDYESIENKFLAEDENLLYTLDKVVFHDIIKNKSLKSVGITSYEDIDDKVEEFSNKNLNDNVSKKLKNRMKVNYKEFIFNLVSFNLKEYGLKEATLNSKKGLVDMSKANNQFVVEEQTEATEFAPNRKKKKNVEFRKNRLDALGEDKEHKKKSKSKSKKRKVSSDDEDEEEKSNKNNQFAEEEIIEATEFAPNRKTKKKVEDVTKKKKAAVEDYDMYGDAEEEFLNEFKNRDQLNINKTAKTTKQIQQNTNNKNTTNAKANKKVVYNDSEESEESEEVKPKKKAVAVNKKVVKKPVQQSDEESEEEDYVVSKNKKANVKPKAAVTVATKNKKQPVYETESEESEEVVEPKKKENKPIAKTVAKKKLPEPVSEEEVVKPKQKVIEEKKINVESKKVDSKADKNVSTNSIKKNVTLKDANNKDLGGFVSFDYKIKESDYYISPWKDPKTNKPKKCMTIFNSEDAAIKACEDILNNKNIEVFEDPEFGESTTNTDLNKYSIYINGKETRGALPPNAISWYRIDQIYTGEEAEENEKNPVFLDEGAESNDVMQGALGDCWFISALSVIATKSYLLKGQYSPSILDDGIVDNEEIVMMTSGIYPPIFHPYRKKRLFCFKFFKNFKWRYVLIDDRLPCRKIQHSSEIPRLLYAKCRNEREFWVPLIEKAYAKLHGSYQALISGFIDEGLVDLTGLVSNKLAISKEQIEDKTKSDELWNQLLSWTSKKFTNGNTGNASSSNAKMKKNIKKEVDQAQSAIHKAKTLKAMLFTDNKTMLGCSVDSKVVESEVIYHGNKCGILAGHAYAILDAFEIPKPEANKSRKTSRILRIRNPWGFKEWNGKWSDNSDQLEKKQAVIEKVLKERYKGTTEKINLDDEDGTFLMCFSDFRRIFNKLFVCIDFPPNILSIRFSPDCWDQNTSGGIPINNTEKEMKDWACNPQYWMKVGIDSEVTISIIQKDGRSFNDVFPYAENVKKCCVIIMRCEGKKKMSFFDGNKVKLISPIRMGRENTVTEKFEAGEYLIVPSTFKKGDCSSFQVEFHFSDSLESGGNKVNKDNFQDYLQNFKFERIGNSEIKPELIIDDIADQVTDYENSSVLVNKKKYILSKMSDMIQDQDTGDNIKTKKNNDGGEDEYDDDDY